MISQPYHVSNLQHQIHFYLFLQKKTAGSYENQYTLYTILLCNLAVIEYFFRPMALRPCFSTSLPIYNAKTFQRKNLSYFSIIFSHSTILIFNISKSYTIYYMNLVHPLYIIWFFQKKTASTCRNRHTLYTISLCNLAVIEYFFRPMVLRPYFSTSLPLYNAKTFKEKLFISFNHF